MKNAARWMLPLELMIGCVCFGIAIAAGVDWGHGGRIFKALEAAGADDFFFPILGFSSAIMIAVSLFELLAGRRWSQDSVILWARIRWFVIVNMVFVMLYAGQIVLFAAIDDDQIPAPLFVAVLSSVMPFLFWVFWETGKVCRVYRARPELMVFR